MNTLQEKTRVAARKPSLRSALNWPLAAALCLCAGLCLYPVVSAYSQQTPAKAQLPAAAAASPPPSENIPADDQDQVLPGDWGPELLYGVLSSPNEEAQYDLMRATFAAGPSVIPQLTEALKDDRTAEFAAQSLSFIGGEQTLPILWKLLDDQRDLNLRRFTYGALAEYDSPQATNMLLDVIKKSDDEPDRTVTEAAVIALTVRTDPTLLPQLANLEKNLQDVVIKDDLDNARTVIEERVKYLASPEGKKAGGSVESAVRTYFMPALEPSLGTDAPTPVAARRPGVKTPATPSRPQPKPDVTVDVRNVTLSPDQNRALARVAFEDPSAIAYYDFVLQRRFGDWQLASVWLGPEVAKPGREIRENPAEAPRPSTPPPPKSSTTPRPQ